MYLTFKIDEKDLSKLSWWKADQVHMQLMCEIVAIQKVPCIVDVEPPKFSKELEKEYESIKLYYEHEVILKVVQTHPPNIIKEDS
jgi:hypothetical protein